MRSAIFYKNLEKINLHNKDATKTWKEGINQLADWTVEERKSLRGYTPVYRPNKRTESLGEVLSIEALPVSVDWRTKGVITAVKDQGQCGSCWSFGAAETLESYWALATGNLMVLSEQQILDCTQNPNDCGGTGGCGGGTGELAYTQIMKQGGLTTEALYPYASYDGTNFQCTFNNKTTPPFAKLTGYKNLPSNQYNPVLTAIATVGPLDITVDAGTWSFYESGVYDGCDQQNPDLDHAVQLVGYGTDPSAGDYWLVRNSWASSWGENGYIRLARTSTLRCGTDTQPSDGTGCTGGPTQVTVCGTCGILYDTLYPIVPSQ